jgi:Domain of unknown function (DUF5658)
MFHHAAIVTATLLSLTLSGLPASAADGAGAQADAVQPAALVIPAFDAGVDWSQPPRAIGRPAATAKRPAALSTLYLSLAAAEIFDAYTTEKGLSMGALEGNGAMAGFASHRAALWTMKVVGAVVPMIIAERMWKTNRAGAIVTMVLTTSVMAIVAANNARVLARIR